MFTEIDRAITGLGEKEEAEKKEGDKPPPLPPRPHEYPQALNKPPPPLPPKTSHSPPNRSPPPLPVEQYDPLAAATKETARRQKYQMKRQQPDPTYDKLDAMPQYSSSSSEEDVQKEGVTTSPQLPAAHTRGSPPPPTLHDGLQRSGSSHDKLEVSSFLHIAPLTNPFFLSISLSTAFLYTDSCSSIHHFTTIFILFFWSRQTTIATEETASQKQARTTTTQPTATKIPKRCSTFHAMGAKAGT